MKNISFFLFLSGLICFAQNKTESQLVIEIINSKNEPVAFAEVYNKTDKAVYISDINGIARVDIKTLSAVLEISVTGYKTQNVQIDSKAISNARLEVVLVKDILGLDEVVVTGTRNRIKKRDSPVVVSTVS